MGHERTWFVWINKLSPISPSISNTTLAEREAMAHALSIAAPQGPTGVQCLDECQCGADVPTTASIKLHCEMIERGWSPKNAEQFLARARDAIRVDLTLPSPRAEFPARLLADANVLVSARNADVVHARKLFPRTWSVVDAALERELNGR